MEPAEPPLVEAEGSMDGVSEDMKKWLEAIWVEDSLLKTPSDPKADGYWEGNMPHGDSFEDPDHRILSTSFPEESPVHALAVDKPLNSSCDLSEG